MRTQLLRQFDFSGGELDEDAKRGDDNPLVRGGMRNGRNLRITGRRKVENRPGRSAQFPDDGRVEEVRMSPSATYFLCFGDNSLKIRDSTGAIVAAAGDYGWQLTNFEQIVWTKAGNDIVMFMPGFQPEIARWDGVSAWTFLKFNVQTSVGGQKRIPFHRFAAKGITMLPSALTGAITVTFSANVLVNGHIGTRMRYGFRQITITGVTSGTLGNATVNERLLGGQRLTLPATTSNNYSVGDIVTGSVSGARGQVAAFPSGTEMDVVMLTPQNFQFVTSTSDLTDAIIGPNHSAVLNAAPAPLAAALASTIWDEEIFNSFRGWPGSGNYEQDRLILCDFASLPNGIAWSAVGTYDDLHPGALATDAIFEFAPRQARVYHVVGDDDQFVFTDQYIHYIPISENNPLKPGSIAFRRVTSAAASSVRPVSTTEAVLFVNAAKNNIGAIVPTGQTARPYIVRDISPYHSHLIGLPKALAVAIDGPFPEPYVFALNTDGSMTVGKFDPGKEWVGWVPWDGSGIVEWVSALGANLLMMTKYTPGGVTRRLCEKIAIGSFLDAQQTINASASPLMEIPGAIGTNIGNMTAGDGLISCFDHKFFLPAANAAMRAATNGFAGKQFATPQRIDKVLFFPSRDNGFAAGATGTLTFDVRASQTAPNADGSNGTSLGSLSQVDSTSFKSITSSDNVTAWSYVWVRIADGAATNIYLTEILFYNPANVRTLWPHAGGTVRLMDGSRDIGNRTVDAYGEIVQVEGEDLSVATLIAGHVWTAYCEPFVPHAGEGQDFDQTMKEREMSRLAVAFQKSTGYLVQRMRKVRIGHVETWEDVHRVDPYLQGENQDVAPPQREGVHTFPIQGSDFDPRVRIVKDTPGTLRIIELSEKVGV